MKKLSFTIAILISGILCSLTVGAGSKNKNLTALIERVLVRNPQILEARAVLEAHNARIPQAGAWDDPRIYAKFMNIPIHNPSFKRTPMSGKEFGVSQRIPLSGTKGAAKKVAYHEAQAAEEKAIDTIAQIIWLLKDRYYQLAAVNTSIYITSKNKRIADELVNLARTRFQSDEMAPAQDVLRAQLDYGTYTDQIYHLTQIKESLLAELKAIVADGEPIKVPNSSALRGSFRRIKKDDILNNLENHPRVKNRVALLKASEKGVSLAKRSVFPDFDLSFSYRQRDLVTGDPVAGEDFFSAGVSIPLPIFAGRKQLKKVEESKARYRASKAKLQGIQERILFELEDAFAKYKKASREIALISGSLLPQAQETMKTSQAEYEAGKVEFNNVLTAQLAAYRYEVDLVNSRADRARQASKLEYLLGGLEDVPDK